MVTFNLNVEDESVGQESAIVPSGRAASTLHSTWNQMWKGAQHSGALSRLSEKLWIWTKAVRCFVLSMQVDRMQIQEGITLNSKQILSAHSDEEAVIMAPKN